MKLNKNQLFVQSNNSRLIGPHISRVVRQCTMQHYSWYFNYNLNIRRLLDSSKFVANANLRTSQIRVLL